MTFITTLLKKNFDGKLLFTDTDSLAYEIESESVNEEFFKWKDLFGFVGLILLCMDRGVGRSKFTPRPHCRIFFLITFFSLKLRACNFLTLSLYPLDTMWQNFIRKY